MYKSNDFQMWVIHDGDEQKIISDSVYLPFGSEYAIRIRNNNSVKAKFKLEIDGVEESDYFVVDPFSTMTIERFMCGSLSNGKKFKFVKATDQRVRDSKEPDNGLIRVKLWKEKQEVPKIIEHYHHYHDRWPVYREPRRIPPVITWSSSMSDQPCGLMNTTMSCLSSQNNNFVPPDDMGATVKGSASEQKFINVSDFDTEVFCTILEIRIRGTKESILKKIEERRMNPLKPSKTNKALFCTNCGEEIAESDKYCSNCGHQNKHKQ